MEGASKPLQFVFYSELFFFERRDPDLVPFGIRHLGVDRVFELLMFFGEFLDMPLLKCHAIPLHLGVTIKAPSPLAVTALFRMCLGRRKGNP